MMVGGGVEGFGGEVLTWRCWFWRVGFFFESLLVSNSVEISGIFISVWTSSAVALTVWRRTTRDQKLESTIIYMGLVGVFLGGLEAEEVRSKNGIRTYL
ncbi:hypothetical protein L195_g011744 [Trifolium pratense]|uniref:Uncharacterized protein n=1 Tax=Trifolium pratense TaxID=57577 RepID=A0A2K3PIG7_TRIPR|nr:hypothetical protein L195_g011744 [Trifolium pratense]